MAPFLNYKSLQYKCLVYLLVIIKIRREIMELDFVDNKKMERLKNDE